MKIKAIGLLFEAGANPNLTDKDGKTAFMKSDSDEIQLSLIRYGARK